VKTTGCCIGTAAELSTSMEFGQYNFNTGKASLGFFIYWNSATIIVYFNGAIRFKVNFNFLTVTR